MLTRIVKLKNRPNILMGRDLNNIFKDGHVYDVRECLGEIMITDLGEHALMEKYDAQPLDNVIKSGTHCFTKEEYEKIINKNLNKL